MSDASRGAPEPPWRPHPDTPKLRRAVERAQRHLQPWEGDCARTSRVRFAGPRAFVSGMGSFERGGRWNPPGLFPAVYGSLTTATALDESRGAPASYGIGPEAMRNLPLYMNVFHARVARLLDLTAGRVRQTLRVSRRAMRNEDWKAIQNRGEEALTQALGRACWEAGIEGILVPSAPSPKGVNAVFFPDRFLASSSLTPRPDGDLGPLAEARDR